MKFLKFQKMSDWNEISRIKNLLTVDSDRANLPLQGGIMDFLVQSNEPKRA